ncbi:hypothetical protein PIB30_083998 [Stylosanthes scabra]|uniref:Uncharacterized protein n=1 Tax=Stylosanthes scabra TaxID=79078 RepID=A0ABU6XQC9_9FABA|nr:hypothetical protein [Stylosanthes scabra]
MKDTQVSAVNIPTSSLPPKKHPTQNTAGEGTSEAAAQSCKWRSQRIAALCRTFFQQAKNQEAITISSDLEPEQEKVEEAENMEEDPEEDPVEAPQGAGIEEDPIEKRC